MVVRKEKPKFLKLPDGKCDNSTEMPGLVRIVPVDVTKGRHMKKLSIVYKTL